MKRVLGALVVFVLVVAACVVVEKSDAKGQAPTSAVSSLWVEPASGYGFLASAILGARQTIDVSMYEMSDPNIEHDLVEKANAGIIVRVLFNSAYEGRSYNEAAARVLTAGHVKVSWAPKDQIFHAKYVVIDNEAAYIGTGNLVASDYSSTRDFWVKDVTTSDVSAVTETFNADFIHQSTAPTESGGLLWSPGSTSTLVSLIGSARRSLLVENEEMNDTTIEQALISAAERGVSVRVVMARDSEWASALQRLSGAGVHVVTLGSSPLYIHAKVICVDCSTSSGTVFVGSENFSVASLVYNRELGVVTTTPSVVRGVETAVLADYRSGNS